MATLFNVVFAEIGRRLRKLPVDPLQLAKTWANMIHAPPTPRPGVGGKKLQKQPGCKPLCQTSGGSRFSNSTITSPTTATMDWTAEMVLVASPIVMPNDSLTSQKPAWFA